MDIGRVRKSPSKSRYGRQAMAGEILYGYADRVTPRGRGIPAQAHVLWDDREMTWELQTDLDQQVRRSPQVTGAMI